MTERRNDGGNAVVLPMPDARVISSEGSEGQRIEVLTRARELAAQGYDRETILARIFGNTALDTIDSAVRANAVNQIRREDYETQSMAAGFRRTKS